MKTKLSPFIKTFVAVMVFSLICRASEDIYAHNYDEQYKIVEVIEKDTTGKGLWIGLSYKRTRKSRGTWLI